MQLRNNGILESNYRPHLFVLRVFHRPTVFLNSIRIEIERTLQIEIARTLGDFLSAASTSIDRCRKVRSGWWRRAPFRRRRRRHLRRLRRHSRLCRACLYAPFYAANSSYVYGTFGNFFGKDILRGCVFGVVWLFTRHFTQLILLTFTAHLGTSSVRISYAVASLASFGSLRAILRS